MAVAITKLLRGSQVDLEREELRIENSEKELGRVRSKLVEKASKALLDQLLDDLLEDGILNDGERESITEENRNRADKARCLIDTVRKKGEAASKKMICHLQQRDLTLYTELGLTFGQPV